MLGAPQHPPLHQSWVWLLLASYVLLMVLFTRMVTVADALAYIDGSFMGAMMCAAAVIVAVIAGRGDSLERRSWFWLILLVAAMLLCVEWSTIVRMSERSPRSMPRLVINDAEDERLRRQHALREQLEQEAAPPEVERSEDAM